MLAHLLGCLNVVCYSEFEGVPKVKIFLWRTLNDVLRTKVNLTKRKDFLMLVVVCAIFPLRL